MSITLPIEIWSDVACPWCYVGKRRLEAALARFEDRDAVRVRWRAFELDPSAPAVQDDGLAYEERLARKYGTSLERAREMIRGMTETARADGLDLRFHRIRPGNTFDAHRLLKLADERGLQDVAHERVFRAYLTEGAAIGDREVLARLAVEIGLDADEARALLAGDRFASDVRADEEEARRSDVHAVPHFVIAGRYALAGAQPPELLLRALEAGRQALSQA